MRLLQEMEMHAKGILERYFAEQLDRRTLGSPRSMGDAIESVLAEQLQAPLKDLTRNFAGEFARRAFADMAFEDLEGRYFIFDVKTHNVDTKFNMPNLTSVERLARFYHDEADSHYFCLVHVAYRTQESGAELKKLAICPIEHLSWNCLTIGALGWGQIQIANSNRIEIDPTQTRKAWMLQLFEVLTHEASGFYPKEIEKIQGRIGYFENERSWWMNR